MTQKRTATLKGNPITLLGPVIQIGDKAPDFTLNRSLVDTASLQDFAGKVKLISVVPSLDTGVCDQQTRKFNEVATQLGEAVQVLTVSVDLPFAQERWCGAAGVDQVVTLSDYKTRAFGLDYGVLIEELQLLMRAIFVVDQDDKVTYVQYLDEMTEHPNYDAAVDALKSLLS